MYVMLEKHLNHRQKFLKGLLVMGTSQQQRQQKTQFSIVIKRKLHPGKIFSYEVADGGLENEKLYYAKEKAQ